MGRRRTYVGTSGWTYDDWAGAFYPPGVTGATRLGYYATQFATVEVNATFYRLPTDAMIRAWNDRLPPRFHLVLKGSQAVTHRRKLTAAREGVARFWERAQRLAHLRVILWQLPPTLHKDLARLDAFLDALPGAVRHAVEFRHESWWDDDVVAHLRRRKAAFVTLSHPALPGDIMRSTNFLYLRFHGIGPEVYQYKYSTRQLAAWARRVKETVPASTPVYAFFNNDVDAHAPANARTFARLMNN